MSEHCLNCGHAHDDGCTNTKCPCTELSAAPSVDWDMLDYGYEFHNQHMKIELTPRPAHCNRGRWIAKVFHDGCIFISEQDSWPRYYFSLDVAMSELEEWVQFRENQPLSHYSHLLKNCPNRNRPTGFE